jgi:hypothetical protein
MKKEQIKAVPDCASTWPKKGSQRRSRAYHATPDELRALDEAERSGIATDDEVEAAFRSFRRNRERDSDRAE